MNDIEHTLSDAFGRRHLPGDVRPSLTDVKARARRRHHRRTAGGVTALALTGVGGIALMAHRGPSTTGLHPADDGGLTPSTLCIEPAPTTVPATTVAGELRGTTTTIVPLPECTPEPAPGQWRCLGTGVPGTDGYTYYDSCEQTGFPATTTSSNVDQTWPAVSSTTSIVDQTWPAVSSTTTTSVVVG